MGNNKKKSEQLKMAHGTAAGKLRKMIMWRFIVLTGSNRCFQCKKYITDIDDLSIEHKVPWLDSEDPVGLYFDMDNIAFSHRSCNYGAARNVKSRAPIPEHGTYARYQSKTAPCKCSSCLEAKRLHSREWDKKVGRTGHNKV